MRSDTYINEGDYINLWYFLVEVSTLLILLSNKSANFGEIETLISNLRLNVTKMKEVRI